MNSSKNVPKKFKSSRTGNSSSNYSESNLGHTSSSPSPQTSSNSSDIPGFYYDPVKKRYFKVQSNSFGIQASVTSDSLKSKESEARIQQSIETAQSHRSLVTFLHRQQAHGLCEKLKFDYEEILLAKSNLHHIHLFNFVDRVKQIQLFPQSPTTDANSCLFVNLGSEYKIFNLNLNLLRGENRLDTARLQFIRIDSQQPYENLIDWVRRNLDEKIEMHSLNDMHRQYVLTQAKIDSDSYSYKISQLEATTADGDGDIERREFFSFNFQQPSWQTCFNFNGSKLALCLTRQIRVVNLAATTTPLAAIRSPHITLDTRNSDAFCARFKPRDENLLFAGVYILLVSYS
jgi:hypothetical protein